MVHEQASVRTIIHARHFRAVSAGIWMKYDPPRFGLVGGVWTTYELRTSTLLIAVTSGAFKVKTLPSRAKSSKSRRKVRCHEYLLVVTAILDHRV